MAGEDHLPLSGASLGLDHTSPGEHAPAPGPFDVAADERYVDAGLLGRGGMGEVHVVYDGRLSRLVALKSPLDPALGEYLVAEATLTARLVHPGIVAIYDAGRTSAGAPFYTMPVIRGRSLAEVARSASPQERLRLVRHFLDACQAMAYAHSQGLVHRDLKPSNIMVGQFGETLVVDWGVAGPAGQRPQTRTGVVGTVGYMGPEQARGEPLTPAADVFALGRTLLELLGDIRSPELMAIAERATRDDVALRYPDARALADDVEAWFEGRRVAAHDYTLAELIRRAWQKYRFQIGAGLLALGVVVVVTVVAGLRTSQERDRAREAERTALEALDRSEKNLTLAKIAQSVESASRGRVAEAEILAASALTHGESPDARGVLSTIDGAHRPVLLGRIFAPTCQDMASSADGSVMACLDPDGVKLYIGYEHLELANSLTMMADQIEMAGNRRLVLVPSGRRDQVSVYDLATRQTHTYHVRVDNATIGVSMSDQWTSWSGGSAEMWLDLEAGQWNFTTSCLEERKIGTRLTLVTAQGDHLALCRDGSVVQAKSEEGGVNRVLFDHFPGGEHPLALRVDPSGTLALISVVSGGILVVDLTTGRLVDRFGEGDPTPLDGDLTETRAAVVDSQGHVQVWDISSRSRIVSLVTELGAVNFMDGGRRLRIAGHVVGDWKVPEVLPWQHLRTTSSGVSAVSMASNHRFVSGHGDGHVRVWRMDSDRLEVDFPLHSSVVKDVEISPDGRWAVAVCAEANQLFVMDLEPPYTVRTLPALPGPRVGWMEGGALLLAPYSGGILLWPDGVSAPIPFLQEEGRVGDTYTLEDGKGVLVLFASGRLFRFHVAPTPGYEWVADLAPAKQIAGNIKGYAFLDGASMSLVTREGEEVVVRKAGNACEIAMSPDGKYVAEAYVDGTLALWHVPSRQVVAYLRGHLERPMGLAFDPTGQWLVSGSWEGEVRLWSMSRINDPPTTLLLEAQVDWGATVEEILANPEGIRRRSG